MDKKTLFINNIEIEFDNEKNLLEVIRKANIDIPTFCYHSELSIIGACRLCLVEIEGKGIVASCSTQPNIGLKVKTYTKQIREIRKIAVELLLANHDRECSSCPKSSSCTLQEIANKLGITEVRFKKTRKYFAPDISSHSVTRNPNKCILCGDCVRACHEIQGIGIIDFAYRGSNVSIVPALGKNLHDVDCVNCGQCARVCSTAAIIPKSNIDEVWAMLDNPNRTVVIQIAPSIRVAVGEAYNIPASQILTGQIVSALKTLGFNKVFDVGFGADLTILEEAKEFIGRFSNKKNLPLMTSCCPAWVKYVEQYYPEHVDHISSCKSPQLMLGSILKEVLPKRLGIRKENIFVVSIAPCTAKKSEILKNQEEIPDIDVVITTQELIHMFKEAGIKLNNMSPEPFDLPFGFKTGAGIIFGNSGGVTEAMLRYLLNEPGEKLAKLDFLETRGLEGLKTFSIQYDGQEVKIAIVQGLKNAQLLLEKINNKQAYFDFIEVMACPGGCIGGAGQPISFDIETLERRAKDIYGFDKLLQLHKPQDNIYIKELYKDNFDELGENRVHKLLHTSYQQKKKPIQDEEVTPIKIKSAKNIKIKVCIGTSCFVNGSQTLLNNIIDYIDQNELNENVNVKATFCLAECDKGPNITINGEVMNHCTTNMVISNLKSRLI
jgi:NADH-quinone oxidoreductase subunit G